MTTSSPAEGLEEVSTRRPGWELEEKVEKGEAPGPNIRAAGNNLGINRGGGGRIARGENDWATSWDGFWTPLVESQRGGGGTENGTAGNNGGGAGGDTGMSMGAKIGLGVGITLGMAVLAAAGLLLWRRRRRQKAREEVVNVEPTRPYDGTTTTWDPSWKPVGVAEVAAKNVIHMPVEADGGERGYYYNGVGRHNEGPVELA